MKRLDSDGTGAQSNAWLQLESEHWLTLWCQSVRVWVHSEIKLGEWGGLTRAVFWVRAVLQLPGLWHRKPKFRKNLTCGCAQVVLLECGCVFLQSGNWGTLVSYKFSRLSPLSLFKNQAVLKFPSLVWTVEQMHNNSANPRNSL